jgi:hypothetical protein
MCVEEQDILGATAVVQKFLSLIPDEPMRQELEKELQKHSTSKQRWDAVTKYVGELRGKVAGTLCCFFSCS